MTRASIALVCAATVSGCGLLDDFSIMLINEYAESVFSVTYSLDNASYQTALEDVRLGSGESSETVMIEIKEEKSVRFRVSAMSLGEELTWESKSCDVGELNSVELTYDYDLATAEFVMKGNEDAVKCFP